MRPQEVRGMRPVIGSLDKQCESCKMPLVCIERRRDGDLWILKTVRWDMLPKRLGGTA